MNAALDAFFAAHPDSRRIFDVLLAAVESLGPVALRVTRSQVAFWRAHPFAWAWIPGIALRRPAAPLVLTLALRRRDPSPRWKQIVEPAAGHFTHHLELASPDEIDDEVRAWLREAAEAEALTTRMPSRRDEER